jgi:transposase
VRAVVTGQRLPTVSDALPFTYSALRKWGQRLASHGPPGLGERPRPGRPRKITCEVETHLNRLVDHDPLPHGSIHAPWSCQELAAVLAHQTGGRLSRESGRGVLKNGSVGRVRHL